MLDVEKSMLDVENPMLDVEKPMLDIGCQMLVEDALSRSHYRRQRLNVGPAVLPASLFSGGLRAPNHLLHAAE